MNLQFAKFLAVGVLNTAFGYAMFSLFLFVGLHYALASLCALLVGIVFSFKTMGKLVFGSRDNGLLFKFFCMYLAVYLLNVGFLSAAKQLQMNLYLANALFIVPMAVLSFVLNKYVVFRK
jgi:putative flippase GtrA